MCGKIHAHQSNKHATLKVPEISFLSHSDAQLELSCVILTILHECIYCITTMWLADHIFALMSRWTGVTKEALLMNYGLFDMVFISGRISHDPPSRLVLGMLLYHPIFKKSWKHPSLGYYHLDSDWSKIMPALSVRNTPAVPSVLLTSCQTFTDAAAVVWLSSGAFRSDVAFHLASGFQLLLSVWVIYWSDWNKELLSVSTSPSSLCPARADNRGWWNCAKPYNIRKRIPSHYHLWTALCTRRAPSKKKPLAEVGSGRSSHLPRQAGNEEEEREEKRSRETINSKRHKLTTAGERRQKLMTQCERMGVDEKC